MASDGMFGVETRVFKARYTGTLEQLGKIQAGLKALHDESEATVEVLEWHEARRPAKKQAARGKEAKPRD